MPEPSLGLYVHWPYCEAVCPYCDFNVHVAEDVDAARWLGAYLAEIQAVGRETPGRTLTSIFFGGGTPSLMAPGLVLAVIEAARATWTAADDLEVSLEANPADVLADGGKLKALKDAGATRLSLGVQSLDDATLRFLGRNHSADDAKRAAETAGKVFSRWSMDLIYGLKDQDENRWRKELEEAAAMAGGHVSAYQLTIERGTPFHRDNVATADADAQAGLYAVTGNVLAGAGLARYEVSNHAGPDARCRHNVAIWQGAEYAGIGPGAHGRLSGTKDADGWAATYQVRDPGRWLDQVGAEGHGTAKLRALKPGERAEEMVMLGLRLTDGIDEERFRARTGLALLDALDAEALSQLTAGGLLEHAGGRLRATVAGLPVLDSILARLLSGA